MALELVEVTQEVLLAVLTHAHSTESEEVMGLLLGDVREADPAAGAEVAGRSDGAAWQATAAGGGGPVCRVSLAFPQIRTDRRKDRVECSPEQLARCSAHAERLSRETGRPVRVIGWYHSHPHITVLPSHVDVRTQAMYQMLDPGFVGLIVSAFNRDSATEASGVQLTAFQSLPDSDPHSGAVVRRGVPVSIVPAACPLERSFADVMVVERTLLMEEHEVYKRAVAAAAAAAGSAAAGIGGPRGGAPSLDLSELHHAGVYTSHMVRLLETCLRPAIASMAALAASQAAAAEQLRSQIAGLTAALETAAPPEGDDAAAQAAGEAGSAGVAAPVPILSPPTAAADLI